MKCIEVCDPSIHYFYVDTIRESTPYEEPIECLEVSLPMHETVLSSALSESELLRFTSHE